MTLMTRIDELQADRALWGLDRESEQELERVLQVDGREPDESWEHCAALMTQALQSDTPGGPSLHLMESLRAAAPGSAPGSAPNVRPRRVNLVNSLLAAAVLIMTAMLWLDREAGSVPASQLRQGLLETRSAAMWSWQPGPVQGDVVWDSKSQRGYMRFTNLPINNPAQRQYQLWIVDGKRDPAHPVDGGVFDIPSGQKEVVIPINPKILVHEAQAFVVTVEDPGGVVVSDRKQIAALAKSQ